MEEIIVYSPEEFAETSAKILIDAAKGDSRFSAALPGGRSVAPVLEGIRRLPDGILGRYDFYLVDERWERDHNSELLEKELFAGLLDEGRITRDQLRFPDVSLPVDREVQRYAGILPELSVAFLGVGEDGHVASLFPEHPVLESEEKAAYLTDSPKPPPTRLSLTFRALSRASRLVLIFWGGGKREAYRRFRDTDDWNSTPACYFKGLDITTVLRDGRIRE